MRIREHGGVAQKQAQVQVVHICPAIGEEHAEHIHHHHAGKIIEVKFQGAPSALDHGSQRVVAEQHDGHQQNVQPAPHSVLHGQRIGNEPPNLAPEDQGPIKR